MKTTFITLIACFTLSASVQVHAQMSKHRFDRLFEQAFGDVLVGNYTAAQPALEQLTKADADHAQVAYLLGLVYVKQGREATAAVALLQSASKRFNARHQHGRVEDTSAPGAVWLLLGDALAATGRHVEAVSAYRTYMTTISMASIQRKSEVIERIQVAKRNAGFDKHATNGSTEQFAALVP